VAPITVVVAARRPATQAACARALDGERDVRVVGRAETALGTVQDALALRPRVLVLEASLWPGALTALLRLIRARAPRTRVLVVGSRVPVRRVLDALAHGAHGHLERGRLGAWLARAVRVIAAGQTWFSRKLVPNVLSRLRSPSFRTQYRPRGERRQSTGRWSTKQGRLVR
jgi:DNA-binding NarL/FixJ family response regulator